jgi:hypothetical protein
MSLRTLGAQREEADGEVIITTMTVRHSTAEKERADKHHMHIVDAVSLVWRTLSNLSRIIVTRLQHWTAYLPRPFTAMLMLVAGCIILPILTDFIVNSAYAIACQTPDSWIH